MTKVVPMQPELREPAPCPRCGRVRCHLVPPGYWDALRAEMRTWRQLPEQRESELPDPLD